MGTLKALFQAIAGFCGWGKQRDLELNTPAQQANAAAKDVQADRDQAAKDVQSEDLTQLEKDVSR